MIKKKILVTGCNGLLGQKLIEQLSGHSRYNLVATARGKNRNPEQEGYEYMEMDISKPAEVENVITLSHPDYIIHTAAMTNVDACETEKELCLQLNVNAVKYLADASNKTGSHLIHLSTDFIFDGTSGPYDEEAKPNPLSFYAASKLMGEQVVQTFSKRWSIVRTIIVYGVVSDMSRSNIILWIKKNLEEGKPIKVVNDQYRSPTLADDLAKGCILIADRNAGGIFNISGKDFLNIYELALEVAAFWNLDASLISAVSSDTLSQPAKRPPVTGLVIEKARRVLGYEPVSIHEGLRAVDEQLKRFARK
jgi:dTDP-4-dehydrorhamnose reductase